MTHSASRAAGVAGLALATVALAAAPAGARTRSFVAVNRIQALPAKARPGSVHRLHGLASNAGARAVRGRVTLRLLHRYRTPRVLGRVALRVPAHGTRRFAVTVRVPALAKGSYQLAACAPRGIGGTLTCATGAQELLVAGGDAIRGPVAAKQAAPALAPDATCSSGAHTLAPPGDHVYPEAGNGGYKSVHTDTHLVYDAPSNRFLPGTHVDQTILTTQCLTDFSFDFERTNGIDSPTTPGPDMTVGSVEVDGRPVSFEFVQPTYPGDPNGQDDPDPLAHRTGETNPINADNPNPPACAPAGSDDSLQNLPCPANKLVITPDAPVRAGTTLEVEIDYTGRPGVHADGDDTTEGWFRSNNPPDDGGFVTTEPMGTEDWMPLNNHPTAKPTYDFTTITNPDRTAISNGELVSRTLNAPDADFPTADANGHGSVTWKWHMPNPVQDYLVENSVGHYNNGYDDGVHGGVKIGADGTLFYEFQSTGVDPSRVASNKAVMDQQEDITNFQKLFNGPFPFTSDGVVVGTASAGFEEEMETKITFAAGRASAGTLNHENMHQWWGDNVAASLTRYTFLKEGMATLGEMLNTARAAATAAGGYGTPAGNAAFDASMVSQFNSTYASGTTPRTANFWTEVPSDPTPSSLFDNPPTYARPGASYVALRQILGDDRFITALQGIQRDFGGGNISQAQMEAQYHRYIPNHSAACSAKLDQFFTQWWDTAYPPGGGANRPTITGPGLAGGGFYDASGPCSKQNPPVSAATISGKQVDGWYTGPGRPALSLSASDGGTVRYDLDGAGFQAYTGPVALSDGTHTVVFHAVDDQGNQEADQTLTVKVDVTSPVTTATTNPPLVDGHVANATTVTLTATDALTGVASTEYQIDGAGFRPYIGPFLVTGGGLRVVQFRSIDGVGNVEATQTLNVLVEPAVGGTVTGTVPATLALTLGAPASFGPFTPGVTRDYTASTNANVTSTAADAALSVSDPSANAPGHLVNGAFSLPSTLQASASSPAAGPGGAPASLGASPVTLLGWSAPVSNDPVTVTFLQHVASTDPLRTGAYAKTLTFTLSTTTP